jgi:hypothetical protein
MENDHSFNNDLDMEPVVAEELKQRSHQEREMAHEELHGVKLFGDQDSGIGGNQSGFVAAGIGSNIQTQKEYMGSYFDRALVW